MSLLTLLVSLLLAPQAAQPPAVFYVATACSRVTVTYTTADGMEQASGKSPWYAVEPLSRGQLYDLTAEKSGGGSCPVVASIYTASLPASLPLGKIADYVQKHGYLRATAQSDAPFGMASAHWSAGGN